MSYLKKSQSKFFDDIRLEDTYDKSRIEEDRDMLRQMLIEEFRSDPEVMAYYIVDTAPDDFIEEMLNDLLDIREETEVY